jgi:hypothetical protein
MMEYPRVPFRFQRHDPMESTDGSKANDNR